MMAELRKKGNLKETIERSNFIREKKLKSYLENLSKQCEEFKTKNTIKKLAFELNQTRKNENWWIKDNEMRHAIYEFDDLSDNSSVISSSRFENASENNMLYNANNTARLPSLTASTDDQWYKINNSKSTRTLKLPKINEKEAFLEFKKRFMFHKPLLLKNDDKIKAEMIKKQILDKWNVEKENKTIENKTRVEELMKQVDILLAATQASMNPKKSK